MSLEQKDGDRVAVALFPVDYAPVEVVTDAGEEILQQLRRFSFVSPPSVGREWEGGLTVRGC
jgi:hypothetical protein